MEVQYSFLRTTRHEAKHTTRLAEICLVALTDSKNNWLCEGDMQNNTRSFLDVVQRVYAFGKTLQSHSFSLFKSLMEALIDYTSTVLQTWYTFPWQKALAAAKLVEMQTWIATQYEAVGRLYTEAFEEVEAAAQGDASFRGTDMLKQYWTPWVHTRLKYAFDRYIKLHISACELEEKTMRFVNQPISSQTHLVDKLKEHVRSPLFPEAAKRREQRISQLFPTNADLTLQSLKLFLGSDSSFAYTLMQEKKEWEKTQQRDEKQYTSDRDITHKYLTLQKNALEALLTLVRGVSLQPQKEALLIGYFYIGDWCTHPQAHSFTEHLLLLLIDGVDTKVLLPTATLWQEALRRTHALHPTKNTPLHASIEALLCKDVAALSQQTKNTLMSLRSSWQTAVKAHQNGISVEAYLQQHARLIESNALIQKMAQISIPVYASLASRQRHTYVLGKSGSGKTELIKHLVHEDIQAGHGVFVLDPHGDLAQECLAFKLFEFSTYKDRLVYISPEFLQEGFIPQYNPFEYIPEGNTIFEQRNALSVRANELAKSFASFFGNDFTPNMKLLLTNSIKLLLEAPDAHLGSLVDMLYPGGTGATPYEDILHAHHDDTLRQYFLHIFPASRLDLAKMALITRFTEALSNQFFKQMLCTPVSSFPIRDLLKEGKIILINASQAKLSRDGTHILGALLCAELTIMALERAAAPPAERKALFAYIDECQNFLNQSIDKLLAEGRKYGVHLTMANQFLGQFDGNTRLKQSILANTAIKFCGSSSAKDQQVMAKELHFTFSPDVSLGKGRFVFGMEGHKGTLIQSPKKLLPPIQKNPHYTSKETLKTLISSQWEKYYAPLDTSTGKTKPPSPPNTSPENTFIPEIDDL